MKKSITLVAVFTVLCAISAIAQIAQKPGTPKSGAPTTDPWKQAGADDSLRQAFERAIYSLKPDGRGGWTGSNDAQRLGLQFDASGARLTHPQGSVGFHLAGVGYGDALAAPAAATLTGNGTRLEYRRGSLTEWYVNGKQGLEQGFTLAARPAPAR